MHAFLEVRVLKLEESGRHFGHRVDDLLADVEYLKQENTLLKTTLFPAVFAKLVQHKAEFERLGTHMADIVQKAAQVSCGKLCTMQQEADVKQHSCHIAVTEDFRTAHQRIEEQVKKLRRNAEAATRATHDMICLEVLKINALNENLLGRLDVLSNEHETVQAMLNDVISRHTY